MAAGANDAPWGKGSTRNLLLTASPTGRSGGDPRRRPGGPSAGLARDLHQSIPRNAGVVFRPLGVAAAAVLDRRDREGRQQGRFTN